MLKQKQRIPYRVPQDEDMPFAVSPDTERVIDALIRGQRSQVRPMPLPDKNPSKSRQPM